jgi:MFS family permease
MTRLSVRYWRVLGVLVLIAAEALLYGYSYPFFSLALEKRDLANWLIGLNASLAGAGILIFGPFLPRAIHRLGINVMVSVLFAGALIAFAAILFSSSVVVWFAARFAMGTCFSALWTTTEIWLNGVVDDRRRGRIVAASGTLYAACQFVGPVVLGFTGVSGMLPIVVAMIPLAFGMILALLIAPGDEAAEEEHGEPVASGFRSALALAGPVIVAAFLSGVGETAMQSLLPLYGLAKGMSDAGAAGLVAIFTLGEAVLVLALGWMADRFGRGLTLKLAAIAATATMIALPFVAGIPLLLHPVLFLAGGGISGLYALGVILIGHDFKGQRLAVVSTGFGMAYSAGSIVGATPVGLAIDLFGAEALPISIAIGFVGLTVFLFMRKSDARAEPAARPQTPEPPQASEVDQSEAIDVEQPEIRDFEMGNYRKWQEGHLEEWFRQRAAELARRSAEREKAGAHILEGL